MADRKDKINEQQAEQEIREEIREEMKHADQEPAQEQYSLNDDRRVKVLSPGMLVAKRFIRNRMAVTGLVILGFMFVFSFIGGLISPYGQDQFFYTDKTIRRDFGAAKENTEFQYASNNDEVFGLTAQARAMLAIQQGKTTFSNKSDNFTLTKVSDDFYSVEYNGQVVGYAGKKLVNASAKDSTLSFEFNYQALLASASGAKEFTADGVAYTLAEDGSITSQDGADVAYVSNIIVNAISPDVFLSRDFKEKLYAAIATAENGKAAFSYTDESLIVAEEPEEDPDTEEPSSGINTEDPNAPTQEETPTSATAEYDLEYDPATMSWKILQEKPSRQYDQYSFPSKDHWLGTDMYGMDMLTRLMYGGRVSLLIGFIVIIIETVIGVIFGGISGYFGGKVDMFRLHVVCHGGHAFPVESFFHFIEPGSLRSGTIDKNGAPAITKRFCQDPVGYIQGHVAIFPVGASDERADGRAVRIAGNADERSLAAAGKVLGTGMDIRNFHIQHVECMPPGQ